MTLSDGLKMFLIKKPFFGIYHQDVNGPRANAWFSSNSGWKNTVEFLCPQEIYR